MARAMLSKLPSTSGDQLLQLRSTLARRLQAIHPGLRIYELAIENSR